MDAHVAQEQRKLPALKSRHAARRARDARLKFWRIAAVSVFYAAVLGANLYLGTVVVLGKMHAHDTAQQLPASIKTARFTQPLLDGTFCRTVVFDNKTADTVVDKIARCDEDASKSTSGTQFRWGE